MKLIAAPTEQYPTYGKNIDEAI